MQPNRKPTNAKNLHFSGTCCSVLRKKPSFLLLSAFFSLWQGKLFSLNLDLIDLGDRGRAFFLPFRDFLRSSPWVCPPPCMSSIQVNILHIIVNEYHVNWYLSTYGWVLTIEELFYGRRTSFTSGLCTLYPKDLFQPQRADLALWPLELIWPFVTPFCQFAGAPNVNFRKISVRGRRFEI